jgi:hypothetical protein
MHSKPPCRGRGIGHPSLQLATDNTAVCPECGQRLPAFLNGAGQVTFGLHYPPREGQGQSQPVATVSGDAGVGCE